MGEVKIFFAFRRNCQSSDRGVQRTIRDALKQLLKRKLPKFKLKV